MTGWLLLRDYFRPQAFCTPFLHHRARIGRTNIQDALSGLLGWHDKYSTCSARPSSAAIPSPCRGHGRRQREYEDVMRKGRGEWRCPACVRLVRVMPPRSSKSPTRIATSLGWKGTDARASPSERTELVRVDSREDPISHELRGRSLADRPCIRSGPEADRAPYAVAKRTPGVASA